MKFEVSIADLRHRIQIGSIEITENENGFPIEQFIEKGNVWARVGDLSYRKFYSGATENNKDVTMFVIRYQSDFVKDTDLIKFNDITYKIDNVDNVDFKNTWLVIYASVLNRGVS